MLISCFLDLFYVIGLTKNDKELEILILRQQIRILQRKITATPRISDPDRMLLAALTDKFAHSCDPARQRLHQVMLIFKPDTVLRWHRELVRRKWTFRRKSNPGRPKLSSELEALIIQLAKENTRWGYEKIQGELLKLGYTLSISSVRNALKRHRVKPAPQRSTGSWRSFLRHYKNQILACDFFTVETIWFKTIYVLFFIHLGTRKIFVSGCTTNPDTTWITQQARQVVWDLKDNDQKISFLLHDNDTKFTSSFDRVFSSEGVEIVHTPYQAPKANAYAERWVRSVREEFLDQVLIVNERHLHRVLKEYGEYYNHSRPHQGLGQHFPISCPSRNKEGLIRRREVLGGIIHDYYRQPPAENHAYG
jgi:transposase InsO family protein